VIKKQNCCVNTFSHHHGDLISLALLKERKNEKKIGKITRGIGQNGRQSRSVDRGNERGVSLLRIGLERVVDVGLRHGEEHSIDDMDNAVGGFNVGFHDTGTVHRDHLSDFKGKEEDNFSRKERK
jgi:hypothetical protein